MIPACLTAVSSASSALAMPITIMSTQKNVKDKELAGSVVSATVNIHLLGDCLAIPMLAYAVLKNYGLPAPSLESYCVFAMFFVIAKFSVAAIPGGGIIVMTPILEKYLNFTPEMSTLIIALYVIFDPIITGFNVLGNGAFAKLMDNLNQRIGSKK
jgi:Na+/H+-dicarboxylate symporter